MEYEIKKKLIYYLIAKYKPKNDNEKNVKIIDSNFINKTKQNVK